jgi:type I restriction enzyme S subunit
MTTELTAREAPASYVLDTQPAIRKGCKQTEVGVIPEDWEVITLLALAERKKELFDDGDWIESEHITNQGVRLIQTGNIGIGHFIEKDSKKYIYENSFISLRCKELKLGDLLVCRLADPAGRACVLGEIGEDKIVTSVDVTIFRPPRNMANRVFLANLFSTPTWFGAVGDRSGGTTHKRISRGALGLIPIPLPPLPEQEAIAEALSHADALIEGLEQLITKKRHLKHGAMQELLTGKKRLPRFGGEWEIKRLDAVAEIRSGGTPSTNQPAFWNGDILWCTPTDITALNGRKYLMQTARTITTQGLKASSAELLPVNSIVMTSRATIGECAINALPVATNQGFKNFLPFEATDGEFLYYLLQTQKQAFIGLCSGSTFLEIGKTQLAAFEINLPPTKEEQTAIATALSDMDTELSSLKTQLAKARDIKQGMMQELLTGKIRLV